MKQIKNYILKHRKLFAVFAASISIFGYAPFSIVFAMILSFLLLSFLLNNTADKKQRLIIVCLFFLCFNIVNLHWVGNSFLYHSPEPWLVYLMPLAVAGMAFLLTIPYVLVFILLEYRFCNCKNGKINQVKKILQIPVVVVSVELIRSLSVYGFPWNLVGYSIAHNDILLSIVSFGTIFLCSFLIVLIANLLTVKNNKIKIVAILVCLTWYGVGWFKVNTSKVQIMPYSLQTLQAETISHHHFDRIAMRKQFNQYLLMLKQAVKQGFQIIVMPEMAIPYPINTNPNLQKMLQSSLKEGQVLVVGAPAYENYDIYNAMYFISQDEVKRYDKKLLVPFGEFIPARTLFFFMKNFTNNFQDFSIGKVDNKFEFKGQSYLPLICYEAIFPFFVKTNMQKNSIIVNITNDAWFYGTIAPAQHALIAKTRAVENNAKMVRVANAGWSYIKDNYYGFNK